MSKEEFLKEISVLFSNYNKQKTREILEAWYEVLKDYDDRYLKKAIMKIIKSNKFMPSVNEILEEIKNLTEEEIIFTEEEKIKQFEKENIKPKWLGQAIENKELTTEDKAELENIMKDFKESEK